VLGAPSEVDLTRALNDLAATDLVSETRRDPSATSKGCPVYEMVADNDAVLDELADDERLATVVERVPNNRALIADLTAVSAGTPVRWARTAAVRTSWAGAVCRGPRAPGIRTTRRGLERRTDTF